MSKRVFAKLSEVDDWGFIRTLVNGRELLEPFPKRVTLRMPDGAEIEAPLTTGVHSEHVNDMGHESDATSAVPIVQFSLHGQPLFERLGRLAKARLLLADDVKYAKEKYDR